MGFGLGRIIFNYSGGIVRYIFGTIWRTIFNKKKYTFSEYIYGPKNSTDYYDVMGHQFNNRIIGVIFLVVITSVLL